nr:MAG TPA: hypothetical protein [Caudoviricetes sp.]
MIWLDSIATTEWVKYGVEGAIFLIAIAILSVFTYRIKKQVDENIKRSDAQEARVTERQRAVDEQLQQIIALVSHIQEERNDRSHKAKEEEKSRKIDNYIVDQLQGLLVELHCARTYYVCYHNGSWSNNGMSLQKMSISAERTNLAVTSITKELQQMPRSFLMYFDKQLVENNRIFCSDVTDLEQKDTMSYNWLHSHQCTKIAIVGIRDEYHKYLIGFVVAEYSEQYPPLADMSDKKIELQVSKAAERMSGALQVVKRKEENQENTVELVTIQGGEANDK